MSEKGYKVLAIDLDPQGNLSFSLNAEPDFEFTIYDVFKGNADINSAIQHTQICDIISANILLSGVELEVNTVGREFILKEKLVGISESYDFIIIDTPPALSILTINAYACADELIIPMMPEILSLQGISQLKETIFAVQKYYNTKLIIRGILLNKYNPRLILTKEVEELATLIAQQLNTKIFDTKISSSVVVAEAPAHGICIQDYAPKSKSVREYRAFVNEYLGIKSEKQKRKPAR